MLWHFQIPSVASIKVFQCRRLSPFGLQGFMGRRFISIQVIKKGGGKRERHMQILGKPLLRYLTFPQRSHSCPCNITLPLAGMCGGGSSGSSGGVPVPRLSDFFLMFFLWAFGEELEELLELVTVSPELHERKIKAAAKFWIFSFIKLIRRILFIWLLECWDKLQYASNLTFRGCGVIILHFKCCVNCTCFLDTWPIDNLLWGSKKRMKRKLIWIVEGCPRWDKITKGKTKETVPFSLCRLWKYWHVRTRVNRKMDNKPSEQISTAHRYTSRSKYTEHQHSDPLVYIH